MVTLREFPFCIGKRQAGLNSFELDYTDYENHVLNILHSGKEIEVTWMYSKKAVESANKGTEAAEEWTGSLAVSKPLVKFKQASLKVVFLSIGLLRTLILTC